MDHHAVADIDPDMARAYDVIGTLKKDQIAGLCLRRSNRRTEIFQT